MGIRDILKLLFSDFNPLTDDDYRSLVVSRAVRFVGDRLANAMRNEAETELDDYTNEALIGTADMVHIEVMREAIRAGEAVCRIKLPNGMASGFMIAKTPFHGYIMTNNHVFPTAEIASSAMLQFDYEFMLETQRSVKIPRLMAKCLPNVFFWTNTAFDVSVCAIDMVDAPDIKPVKLSFNDPIRGERAVVIHHPKGGYKSISYVDNKLLYIGDKSIYYELDTQGGSSGSMLYTLLDGEVSGLHRGWRNWVPERNKRITINEAIRMSLILNGLKHTAFPMGALRST